MKINIISAQPLSNLSYVIIDYLYMNSYIQSQSQSQSQSQTQKLRSIIFYHLKMLILTFEEFNKKFGNDNKTMSKIRI